MSSTNRQVLNPAPKSNPYCFSLILLALTMMFVACGKENLGEPPYTISVDYDSIVGNYLCDVAAKRRWTDYSDPIFPVDCIKWQYIENAMIEVALGDPETNELIISGDSLHMDKVIPLNLEKIAFLQSGPELKFRSDPNISFVYSSLNWRPNQPDSVWMHQDDFEGTGAYKTYLDFYWKGKKVD